MQKTVLVALVLTGLTLGVIALFSVPVPSFVTIVLGASVAVLAFWSYSSTSRKANRRPSVES